MSRIGAVYRDTQFHKSATQSGETALVDPFQYVAVTYLLDTPSDPIAFSILCKLLILNLLPFTLTTSEDLLGTASKRT